MEVTKIQLRKIATEDGYVEKADFIKYAQDMKLLDFTGRKVDPSLLLGDMKTKKDKDPNIKVGYIALSMGVVYILFFFTE